MADQCATCHLPTVLAPQCGLCRSRAGDERYLYVAMGRITETIAATKFDDRRPPRVARTGPRLGAKYRPRAAR